MAKAKDRIYMPMGTGGLIRYPEEGKELIKLKPKHVIWVIIGVIIFELILRLI
jgi:preprotein translocase subunit Sec61beta